MLLALLLVNGQSSQLQKRGVVMCAGGGPPFHFALHAATATAKLLRHEFELTWPVELYFAKAEASEAERIAPGLLSNWTAAMQQQGLDASARVLKSPPLLGESRKQHERGRPYSCKAAAVLETGLSEVVFLDSDVALLRSPLALFDSPEYVRTGALFFHDRQLDWAHPSADGSAVCQDAKCVEAWLKSKIAHPSEALKQSNVWRGSSTMRVESGIIAIDKERHSRTLATLEKDYKEYVKVSHGEKEAWWIAAELTGTPYALSPFAMGQMQAGNLSGPCCGLTVHFDPTDGEPLAIHGIKREVHRDLERLNPFD